MAAEGGPIYSSYCIYPNHIGRAPMAANLRVHLWQQAKCIV